MYTDAGYGKVHTLFTTGGIYDAASEDTKGYLCILATHAIANDRVRHHAIVMTNAINGILVERLLEEQEKRNKTMQYCLIAVAIVTMIATIAQVFL